MASSNVLWLLLLMTTMTSYVVYTAPTGVLEQPEIKTAELDSDKKLSEAVAEVEHLDDVDEDIEKAWTEDEAVDKMDSFPAPDDQPAAPNENAEEKEIIKDELDEVINDANEDVIDDEIIDGDSSIQGSSDLFDYLMWEPSVDYYSLDDSALTPWFYDPNEPSDDDDSRMRSSDLYVDEYLLSYDESSASENGVGENGVDNDFDNAYHGEVFGIPLEEVNNEVDQTVDEFLCQHLGLCSDDMDIVQDSDEEWSDPNEVQFTEEGMTGNKDEESEEKDIYTVEVSPEDDPKEKTTNSSSSDVKDEDVQSRPKRDVSSSPVVGSRHRRKRDLSWNDEPGQGASDLVEKINALERRRVDEAKAAPRDLVLTPQERFEDLLHYFKDEAAENNAREGEELYLGAPGPTYEEIVEEAVADNFEDEIEEIQEEEGDEEGIERGEFLDEEEGMDADDNEDAWGAYLVPGSPYREGTLTYDGYKRDDEKEALKVYVESLQNLEGYRKRSDQSEYLDIDPRSTDFLRQVDPRSPPNEIRYPKTGLEPFSREKYFPVFSASDAMSDDTILDPDWTVGLERNDALEKYDELLDLLNTELEAAVLISSIEDMAAELGRDRRLLDELEKEEAEDELQLVLDDNNQDILGFFGAGNGRQAKRTPRVIDYQDFNEYPPEFPRTVSASGRGVESLSDEELLRLYNQYQEEAAEANWGDFVYQPRTRREGEEMIPGPHVGYYVQGRMIGDLMKPKRDWETPIDVDLADGFAQEDELPYVLLQPSDLGYDAWPGDFDVFYDTRDGTFVMYPNPMPSDELAVSDEALLEALGMPRRNLIITDDDEEEDENGKWGDLDDIKNEMQEIDFEIGKLEELRRLTEYAQALSEEERQEDSLKAFIGN